MKILITGATGMVGSEVLRQAILDKDIEAITVIVRRPLEITHAKLRCIIHKNFLDYTELSEVFRSHDACVWCLGISQLQVTKEMYNTITYSYTVEGAKAMLAVNPKMKFMFLSGMGADPTQTSKTLFAKVKGKTENALQKMLFEKLYIIRPGGIRPIHKNKNTPIMLRIMFSLFPLLELLAPSFVISSVQLAKVMLYVIKNGSDSSLIENKKLKEIYKERVAS